MSDQTNFLFMNSSISVVVATFNCEATIERCISSLREQSMPVQLVLVDNESSDRTVEIARRCAPADSVFIVGKDSGVFDAWNKGIVEARNEWIVFLGADDYYEDRRAIEKLLPALQRSSHRVVYGRIKVVDASDNVMGFENDPWDVAHGRLNQTLPFTHVGTAHHRALFDQNYFDPLLRIAGDYDFLYPELLARGAVYHPEYEVVMQSGGLSRSLKNRIAMLGELRAIWRKHRTRPTIVVQARWWLKYLLFSVLRSIKPSMKF